MKTYKITLLLGLVLVSSQAAADDWSGSQLVKTSQDYYVYETAGSGDWALWGNCVATNFAPGRTANISPLSGDPGSTTSNPVSLAAACAIYDSSGDGAADFNINFNFTSLRDIGTWTITCEGGWINPGYCASASSPPCNVVCDWNYGYPWDGTTRFFVTVFNDVPTASISHSPTPAWNQTVNFSANANDPDGGSSFTYRWSIIQKPNGTATTMSGSNGASPSINMTSDSDIGAWRVQLHLDDDEGERITTTHDFTVPNIPPNISINGANDVDALQNIQLNVTPTVDTDGGNFTFSWDVLSSPPTSSTAPQNGYSTASSITIPTTEDDIGIWQFSVTAEDNEGDDDTASITVEVHNLPPEIDLIGSSEIDIGETMWVETTITDDLDGGLLDFSWDVIQAPDSAPILVQQGYFGGSGAAGARLEIPTNANAAGTWIFRLTATDNEGESVDEDFVVLVDAPPIASIQGNVNVGTLSFPTTLTGAGSEDPDSPCLTDPMRCHDTLGGGLPTNISGDIVFYEWTLLDVPYDLYFTYMPGVVDVALGINAHSQDLVIDPLVLEAGDWTFQLEVNDAEGNSDSTTFTLSVIDEEAPPVAAALPVFVRHDLVPATNITLHEIAVSGLFSYDFDNLLLGDSLVPGVGITDHSWSITQAPAGCTLPTISNPTPDHALIYPAGTFVDPSCHGTWEIELTVTDDDAAPKTDTATAMFVIGNCPSVICIDSPTNALPSVVEFTDATDIMIFYHLDSALYADAVFSNGMFVQLDVFHESDLATPVYTDFDLNVLASNLGGYLAFHWNGFSNFNQRPEPGRYSITLTALDASMTPSLYQAAELDAIYIAVAEPSILNTSDAYVDFDLLSIGSDQVDIDYAISGGATVDEVKLTIYDASNIPVHSEIHPVIAASGSISWDGLVTATTTIPTGKYTVDIEALQSGGSLGFSPRENLTIYQMDMVPVASAPSTTHPGLYALVNSDDDNKNNTIDHTESFGTENDLQEIAIIFEPADMDGELTFTTSSPTTSIRLWDGQAKGTETTLNSGILVPATAAPSTLFLEAFIAGETDLSMNFTTADAVLLDPVTIAITNVQVETMFDTNNDHTITAVDAASPFVRIGLWDNAFRMVADANGGIGTLFNEQAENQNFVGRDSRRFYYRVHDASANSNAASVDTILAPFEWYTIKADTTDDDKPPTNRGLTLTETGANTGVFVSRAVMLVTDQNDRDQATHTGLAAGAAVAYDAHNHRTRQVTGVDGDVRSRYTPAGAGAPTFELTTPIFQRMPDERMDLNVRIFNFSDSTGVGTAAVSAADVVTITDNIRNRYAPAGIRTNTVYTAATDQIDLPMGSTINLTSVGDFTGGHGSLTPSGDQNGLITLARAVDPATPANADTIYLMLINGFSGGDRGQSFPDGWLASGSASAGANFVFSTSAVTATHSPAHEIGHMLTNATLTANEASGAAAGWAGGGHYGGAQQDNNLMRPGTSSVNPLDVDKSKRLWDDTAVHTIRQILRARNSRHVN